MSEPSIDLSDIRARLIAAPTTTRITLHIQGQGLRQVGRWDATLTEEERDDPGSRDPLEWVDNALEWIRATTTARITDPGVHKMQVRAYRGTTENYLFATQFFYERSALTPEGRPPPSPPRTSSPGAVLDLAAAGSANASPLLGDCVADLRLTLSASQTFIHKQLIPGYDALLGASISHAERVGFENDRLQRECQRLISENEALRLQVREARSDATAEQINARARANALQAGMKEAGSAVRQWIFIKQGISPRLMAVMELVAGDPELAKALEDPHIHRLLSDPAERKRLAELLARAGEHYAETHAKEEDTPPPPAPPPTDSGTGPGRVEVTFPD